MKTQFYLLYDFPHFFLRSYRLLLLCSVLSLFIKTSNAVSAQVTLAWSRNPGQDVIGYKLYYGIESRDYEFVEDADDQTTHTVSGLEEGETYFFAVTAYNSYDESDFSDEVSYEVPVDGDGIADDVDNCPDEYNPEQEDLDGDGTGDICDNCPDHCNYRQLDADNDGLGDVCDADPGCAGCLKPQCEQQC